MIWAKTNPAKGLLHHMLDTGNMAYALLSKSTIRPSLDILSSYLSGEVVETVSCLVALHDIGKCHPHFQMKADDPALTAPLFEEGLLFADDLYSPSFRHEVESEKIMRQILKVKIENRRALDGFSKIFALHHQPSNHASATFLNMARYSKWNELQHSLIHQVCNVFQPNWKILGDCTNLDACCSIIWGLMMLCDWLSSGQEAFLLDEDTEIITYQKQSANAAIIALSDAGFKCAVLLPNGGIRRLFPEIPVDGLRPVQKTCEELRTNWQYENRFPLVTLIEAPMGEGKTEAALSLASALMQGYGKSGCYFALPTAATSNCMFDRINKCLSNNGIEGTRLLHGYAWLIQGAGAAAHSSREAQSWLAPMRRAILAPYGVGTIDQVLMSVLRIRYTILRLVGLSDKVLIIDEIHAYDAYMQQALSRLLSWARVLRIPVVLLSATLPSEKRKMLLESCGCKTDTNEYDMAYPLITQGFIDGTAECKPVNGAYMQQRVTLSIRPWMQNLATVAAFVLSKVQDGGCAGILVNTVLEAQTLYVELQQHNDTQVELFLFHARFPLSIRQEREDECVRLFGKNGQRPNKAILVATQVVEQSIDLDLDFLVTMLCPIDLLLQRMGRMHRHKRQRPDGMQQPKIVVLVPESWDVLAKTPTAFVYSPWILRKTWQLLADIDCIHLPEDIRPMVEKTYTASAPGDTDFEEWMSMTFRNDVMAEAARGATFPPPHTNFFFMAEGNDIFSGDEENGAVMRGASSRYDENRTMQIALVSPQEVSLANGCSVQQAREVLMRAASVPRNWIEQNSISFAIGQGMLRGLNLIASIQGICRGEKWQIRIDEILGFVKEDL